MRTVPFVVLGLVLGAAPTLAFDCTALTGATISKSAIGLPTSGAVVASASMVSDPHVGTYCKLTGGIKPVDPTASDIKFQVNLPEHWNGKAVQFGGAGLNGTVRTGEQLGLSDPRKSQPIGQGYVTFGSDSGHQGEIRDASFALNAEALANYEGAQLKKTRDTAMALVRRVFHARPRHTYFVGGSEGGREALVVADRWSGDYDGVVSIFPFHDVVALSTSWVLDGQAIFGTPGAWISPAKLTLLSAKVLNLCDDLDGLKDGIIGNVKACRAAFDISALRCVDGGNSEAQCLSDAQIAVLRRLSAPRKLGQVFSGTDTVAPYPFLETDLTAASSIFGTGDDIQKSGNVALGAAIIRFMVMGDPNYDYMHFDPARNSERLQQLSQKMDVSGDLAAFVRRGGKLILAAGSSDMLIPPGNTTAFYERLQAAHGAKLTDFARYYMIPGQAHGGGGGNFISGWDYLGAVDGWVTIGKPPGPQTVTDLNKVTSGRARPLCEYPAYPKYNGSGDANLAASFTCAMP